jgi:glycosyltransferase involved in cell wall biosynthesis
MGAPRIEAPVKEWGRLARRFFWPNSSAEAIAYEANDWLMVTMKEHCRRPSVTAVHSYEDCSLLQFEEAKRLGKACIYDMPIGYYSAWERTEEDLLRRYPQAVPRNGLVSRQYVRPRQKEREMELADVVLAPSDFVRKTIAQFHDKRVALVPYGVDVEFWRPPTQPKPAGALRFICAGQISIRKGTPLLLEAWRRADLSEAELELVGSWHLADEYKRQLPRGVSHRPACDSSTLRERFQAADVFVFPSFFEGFGLVLLEAMACGLPAIATEATAGPDVLDNNTGKVIKTGDVDALVEALRWFAQNRHKLPQMSKAARVKAEACTWDDYRRRMTDAVASFSSGEPAPSVMTASI